MANTFTFTIEDDNKTITTETDQISPMSHKQADELLKLAKNLMGGEVVEKKLPHTHGHQHNQVKVGR